MTGIRITLHNGEYFVAVKHPGQAGYKQDSLWHTPEQALARAAALLKPQTPAE
jgi:hypothetical protein